MAIDDLTNSPIDPTQTPPKHARSKAKTTCDDPNHPLTWMQTVFVRCYTALGKETWEHGTKSAKQAGYKGSDAALASRASEFLKKRNIQAAIKQEIDNATRAAGIDIDWCIREAISSYHRCKAKNDDTNAKSYFEMASRMLGSFERDNRQRADQLAILLR